MGSTLLGVVIGCLNGVYAWLLHDECRRRMDINRLKIFRSSLEATGLGKREMTVECIVWRCAGGCRRFLLAQVGRSLFRGSLPHVPSNLNSSSGGILGTNTTYRTLLVVYFLIHDQDGISSYGATFLSIMPAFQSILLSSRTTSCFR